MTMETTMMGETTALWAALAGLGFTTLVLCLVSAWLGRERARALRLQGERIARLQGELGARLEGEESLRAVVRRHIEQTRQLRTRCERLESQLSDLDSRFAAQSSCGQAIDLARRGGSLDALLRQRRLTPEEAHLIQEVHLAGRRAKRRHAA